MTDKFHFILSGTAIPSITEQPVKSLGKLFDATLKDSATANIQKCIEAWLTKVDKSGLSGRFMAWIYQHSILPRVLWPLLVYTVPLTTVESLERKISGFLRRWLGLPRSLNSAALYGTGNILQLPFSGLMEEFMVARTREALQYRDSRDQKVSSAGIEERTGRKWRAEKAVEVAESRPRQKALVGVMATGRGLSSCGGRACEQDGGAHQCGQNSVDKVGEHTAVQDYLVKHHAGRPPVRPVPCPSCLRCPIKPCKPPHQGQERDTFLPTLLWKTIISSSPQQLPKVPWGRSLSVVP